MKTFTFLPPVAKNAILFFAFAFIVSSLVTSTSCGVGADGRPGLAYITFDWEESEPDFLDCGTSSVPPNFYYGTYYRINPGWYTGYYEGQVWNGSAWGTYAWEMDYEIWVNEGQRGGYGYNGKDGMNTYLDFICNPYGPSLFRHDAYLRKAPVNSEEGDVVPAIGVDNVIEFNANEYSIRLTYRRVEPRTNHTGGHFALN